LLLSDKIKKDIEVMHGDIAQNQREVTLKRFKEGKFNVLVATDVASEVLIFQMLILLFRLSHQRMLKLTFTDLVELPEQEEMALALLSTLKSTNL